jgi:hypothetical protein
MGFRFRGFFSDGDEAAMAAAVSRWPFCAAKPVTVPFRGFGLRAPDPDREAESDEDYERLLELPYALERGLTAFSQGFPAARFVFIDADCFGGTCIYTGFVVQAGEVDLREEAAVAGTESLQRLLLPLGGPASEWVLRAVRPGILVAPLQQIGGAFGVPRFTLLQPRRLLSVALGVYMAGNGTWVCFDCREAVRRPTQHKAAVPCPSCRQPCRYVGTETPLPPKRDAKAWQKLRARINASANAARERAQIAQARRSIRE